MPSPGGERGPPPTQTQCPLTWVGGPTVPARAPAPAVPGHLRRRRLAAGAVAVAVAVAAAAGAGWRVRMSVRMRVAARRARGRVALAGGVGASARRPSGATIFQNLRGSSGRAATVRRRRATPAMGDMDGPSDLDLVRRLRTGSAAARREAFAELHRRHSRRSFQLAFRVLGDPGLAADVVQEVFLTVFRKGARFEERAQFSSWLFRVVLNRSIDMRRRERRTSGETGPAPRGRGGEDAGTEPLAEAPDPRPGPEAAARGEERAAAVRAAIGQLSPKLAEIVALRYPQGLSYEEIGELLDLPPGTVRSRLNRAHAALREILGEQLDGRDDDPDDPSFP